MNINHQLNYEQATTVWAQQDYTRDYTWLCLMQLLNCYSYNNYSLIAFKCVRLPILITLSFSKDNRWFQ